MPSRTSFLWLAAFVAGCGGASNSADEPEINPQSVPSLALLGSAGRGDEGFGSGNGPSCEDVINEQRRKAERGEIGGEEPPPEHGEEIKALLNGGEFLGRCDVDEAASVSVCAAIIDGSAAGVTVELTRGSTAQADCIADGIRRIAFPSHPLVEVARTSFAPM